jgi:hypothetical protein
MHRYYSFALGFGCCLLLFLSILCFLIERGVGERGSGRIEFDNDKSALVAQTPPEDKPDRPPEKGNGRKD